MTQIPEFKPEYLSYPDHSFEGLHLRLRTLEEYIQAQDQKLNQVFSAFDYTLEEMTEVLNHQTEALTAHHRAMFSVIMDILIPTNICMLSHQHLPNGAAPTAIKLGLSYKMMYHAPSRTLWMLRSNGTMEKVLEFSLDAVKETPQTSSNRPNPGIDPRVRTLP